jgi:hypothetical protein
MAVTPIEHAADMLMIGSFLGGKRQERHKEKEAKIATKEVHTSPLERSALSSKPPFLGRITRFKIKEG